MKKLTTMLAAVAAGMLGIAVLTGSPGEAKAQEFRTGGCSGCFNTQMFAAVAEFSSITKVYRLCATGNSQGTTNACAGAAGLPTASPKSLLQDYVVIEGTLKNCGTSCSPTNLGRNGGGFARYYVSANGSGRGVVCASNPKQPIGFLGIFGANQTPGGGDDPGDGNGGVGIPAGWPSGAGPTYSLAATPRAALVQCSTGIQANFVNKVPAGVRPTWSVTAANELCVVDVDADNSGAINNRDDGRAPGFATIGSTETSNLAQACTTGFADLPTADFEDPALSSRTFDQQQSTGAQIFKIVVNRNVRAKGDSTKKIQLQDPQIEGLFGTTNLGIDACSWQDAGGQVLGDTAGKITVCYREFGSGTRETFRNTFMLNPKGSHDQGTTPGTFDCEAFDEGPSLTTTITPKSYVENPTSGDEANCVAGTGVGTGFTGQVGYVNASRTNANWYSVPVFGVDPDAQTSAQLRNLVKCGMYPYWGPLSGGRGGAADPSGFTTAHFNALQSELVFDTSLVPDYLPLGGLADGVAFTKDVTAGPTAMKFKPASCDGFVPNPPLAP